MAACCALACCRPASAADPQPPVERETPREFIDSLSENVLTPDPSQIYRRNGQRREVDLLRGLVIALDEASTTRLGSTSPLPGLAQEPSRLLSLDYRREPWNADAWYRKFGAGREHGADLGYEAVAGWRLLGSLREQRNDMLVERRRDEFYGLAWQAASTLQMYTGWHRARLTPFGTPLPPQPLGAEGEASFLRGGARWSPAGLPGLGLQLEAERALRASDEADASLSRGRVELGADYRFDDPASGWYGVRLYWREALRLGLLSQGEAMDRRAAYQRAVGIEWPDGSPGGSVYSQLSHKSLADRSDALWIVGWRHRRLLAPRWSLQSHIEQATPLAGPTALRSFSVGGRLAYSRHPLHTLTADVEAVNSHDQDSYYGAAKYTRRLGDDWVSAWRASAKHAQPHGESQLGTTDYKISGALAWREPDERRLAALIRYTFAGREAYESASTDRRAHIVLFGASYNLSEQDNATARWSRRWEHDEVRPLPDWRITDFTHLRYTHEFEGTRWSLGGHLAWRDDAMVDGKQEGYGVELGYRLGRKAVLAVGYNPRGFSDHEMTVDERPQQGWVLRLRFSVDAVLSRWLDPPMPRPDEAHSN